ncbi:uncharacterized protein LOC135707759 [Ochlerotatus camptorhynchus]|uniref:uncharacterized protein LOC135707759 n=1 Tax=Ochlerotatus camptorhynchus TaxID=644619 RepID=UPI0031E2951B
MLLFLLPLLVASATATRDSRCVQYNAGAEAMTLSHRSDCTKFYICDVEGNALEMKCPSKTYFSQIEGVCSFDTSGCTGGENNVIEEPENNNESPVIIDNGFKNEQEFLQMACLNQPSGKTLPLFNDCFSYVVCLQQKPIILTCPEGLMYDHRNSKCEFKETADCKVYNIPMPIKPIEVPEQNNIYSVPELLPLEELHNTYPVWNAPNVPQYKPIKPLEPFMSMPQMPVKPEFPGQLPQNPIFPMPVLPVEPPKDTVMGQEFMPYGPVTYSDPRCLQRFDPDNPILLPHSRDCTKYYVCVGNNAIEKLCPTGQHWSDENGWCDFPTRAKCNRF